MYHITCWYYLLATGNFPRMIDLYSVHNFVQHYEKYYNNNNKLISEEDTFLWLSKGDLKAETESEIVAAQDQALHTKYYGKKY